MTDTVTPRATVCDVEGCHTLIPATLEDRREHRRGHTHDKKVTDALRDAIKDQNATIRTLTGRLAELEREVGQIEIPEPVDPFAIVQSEDLEPLDDEDDLDTIDDLDRDNTFQSTDDDDDDYPPLPTIDPITGLPR